jgi:Tol biopolymer transport system component
VRVGHGSPRLLVKTDSTLFQQVALAWSPDGQKLAVSINCEQTSDIQATCREGPTGITALYTIRRDGSHLRKVVAIPRAFARRPEIWGAAWSPDGRRIAYVVTSPDSCCGTFLYTISSNGGTPRVLRAERDPDHTLGAPSWSPDGRWLAYGAHCLVPITSDLYCDLVVQRSFGGERRVLLRSFTRRDTGFFSPAWTPDGGTLLYSQRGDTGSPALLAIDLKTTRRRVVVRKFAAVLATARDSRTFAFIEDAGLTSPQLATLSGRMLDRAPRIPFYLPSNAEGTASLWIR